MKRFVGRGLVVLIVYSAATGASFADFSPQDFDLRVGVDKIYFQPGDVVSFLASLSNLSSEPMIFGGNIRNVSAGISPYVGTDTPWTSPYVENYGFTPFAFSGGMNGITINPGATRSFPFYFIDTAANAPPGTELKIAPPFPGLPSFNIYFANIPSDDPAAINDPNAWDFGLHSYDLPTATASGVPIPEPLGFLLLLAGGAASAAGRWVSRLKAELSREIL
jgi:hypothetical protein